MLHDILALTISCFEKVSTESVRVGLIKRPLQSPEVNNFATIADMVGTTYSIFKVTARLFQMIIDFGQRYKNDSYSVQLYLNLSRLCHAEQDVNDILLEGKKLLREVNFLRF